MSEIALAIFIKAAAISIILLIVGCFVWAANKLVPEGELKTFLFRVRGEKDSQTPPHEAFKVKLIVFVTIVGLYGFIGFLIGR